jgi:hypothetical protein
MIKIPDMSTTEIIESWENTFYYDKFSGNDDVMDEICRKITRGKTGKKGKRNYCTPGRKKPNN